MAGLLGRRPPPATSTGAPARVLTASGRRIDLAAARGTKSVPKIEAWQQDAWAYRNEIGEVRYAIGYLRNAVSRVRVFPAVAEPDGSEPTPLDEAEGVPASVVTAAKEALARLTGGTNDWAALLAPYAENLEVAGEGWLIGRTDPDAAGADVAGEEVWQVRSAAEIEAKDKGWAVRDVPNGEAAPLDPENDFAARLWKPHPQWRGLADSPMRALLGVCEELQLIARMIRSASRSRLAGAGILLLPDEMSFASARDGEDPENPEADPFFTELYRAMMAPLEDEGDASSVVPIVVRAPAEALAAAKHLSLAGVVDEKLLGRIEAALRRLGAGLDVPPEIVTGMADVNHWTAWQIDGSTIKMHVEPLLIDMTSALSAGYLRHALVEYGVPVEWARRVIAWHDVSPLTIQQNRTEDAFKAHERLVLSDRALVEELRFDPDNDMPDPQELARRTGLNRGAIDAALAELLLRTYVVKDLPEIAVSEPPAITAQPALPAEPVDDPQVGEPGGGTPGPDTGAPIAAAGAPTQPVLRAYRRDSTRLADVDRQTREQLVIAADAALARAVERAAARAVGQANRVASARAVVAGAAPGRGYAALHAAGLTAGLGLDPEQLLAGAWDQLASTWDRLTAAARDQALVTAARIAGHDPDDPTVASALAAAAGRLGELAAEGWTWWTSALTRLATDALTDPDAGVDQTGIVDPDDAGEDPGRPGRLTTLTRAALAIAGGLPAGHGGVRDDGLVSEPGTAPGGIAGGDVISSYLNGAGRAVIGYEWVYGISKNHFAPHRRLDGVLFADFTSPVLQNPISWPSATLEPGDHRGCHCDAQPVWADGRLSSLEQDAAADATYDDTYLRVLEEIAAADRAAGRDDTTPIATTAEADRIANVRPSKRS